MANNCTGGIEPLFSPYYFRRKKVNPNDKNVRIDFVDQNGDSWTEYPVLHPFFIEWFKEYNWKEYDYDQKGTYLDAVYQLEKMSKEKLDYYFKQSPWYGSTANDINWIKRVEIQGVIQKYITHSISSTINLPNNVTEKEVSNIYMESWKKGLKGITVYRDGSRSGVLITEPKKEEVFLQHSAPKRPVKLPCDIYHVKSKGKDYTVLIGLFDEKPYEIFALENKIANGFEKGILIKVNKGRYNLITSKNEEVHIDTNIASDMTDEQSALTRLISTSLRHGAEVKFLVEQLQKTHGDLTTFSKVMARCLKGYIPDQEVQGESCDNCGEKNIIYKEGCKTCLSCGISKCG